MSTKRKLRKLAARAPRTVTITLRVPRTVAMGVTDYGLRRRLQEIAAALVAEEDNKRRAPEAANQGGAAGHKGQASESLPTPSDERKEKVT